MHPSSRLHCVLPLASALALCVLSADFANSQGPLDVLKGNTGTRLPDDNVEGTIWEYHAELTSGDKKEVDDELVDKLEGTFRFEDSGVFEVGIRFQLPDRDKIDEFIASLRDGKPQELRLPGAPKQKRIGDYRLAKSNRLRLDLDDDDSLNGVMVQRHKKDRHDVWQGTFQEKEGKRTVRKGKVEIRPIQD